MSVRAAETTAEERASISMIRKGLLLTGMPPDQEVLQMRSKSVEKI